MNKTKIALMHELFGTTEEQKCKDCSNLVRHRQSRVWYKCSVYGETASEASDWRLKYDACGYFNKEYDWIPVIEYKKHMSRKQEEVQIDGQLSLFEEV